MIVIKFYHLVKNEDLQIVFCFRDIADVVGKSLDLDTLKNCSKKFVTDIKTFDILPF